MIEEHEIKHISCETHGVSDEFMVIRCQGAVTGVYCIRCWGDFLRRHVGEAKPIYTEWGMNAHE